MASKLQGSRPWQLDIRCMKAGLAHICRTKEFSDLTFIVGPKKKEFKAHQLFVAARCSKLLNMSSNEDDISPTFSKIISLPNVSEEAFEILLNYIYTSVINKMDNQDLVLDAYQAAITYGLDKLQEECEKLIQDWDINCENVIPMLQMTEVKFVQDRCWDFLRVHARTVLQSDGIMSALSETLAGIFEKGYFTGIPTMELLPKIVGWAAKHYKLEKKENGKASYEIVRNELLIPHGETSKCLMSWIGFQNLTPKEITQVCSFDYPKLLTAEEFMIFITYAHAEGEKPALPDWV